MLNKVKRLINNLTPNQLFDIFFTALAMFLGVYFKWSAQEIIVFGFFIWIILNPVSSRTVAIPAMFFLSLTPLFLMVGSESYSEKSAIYAYYFLVMAMIMGIYEVRKNKGLKKEI